MRIKKLGTLIVAGVIMCTTPASLIGTMGKLIATH